jgi:hypothetical protein
MGSVHETSTGLDRDGLGNPQEQPRGLWIRFLEDAEAVTVLLPSIRLRKPNSLPLRWSGSSPMLLGRQNATLHGDLPL